ARPSRRRAVALPLLARHARRARGSRPRASTRGLAMVKGLDLFRDHFREYADCYVLIRGTASHLALREKDLDFRATKHPDIIPCLAPLAERSLAGSRASGRARGYAS